MSAELYLTKEINEIEQKWEKLDKMFSHSSLDVSASLGFHPEIDESNLLNNDSTQLYQSYIGIMRWAVELGRIDLAHVSGVLACFSDTPREGHLVAVLQTFAYTKRHKESKLIFNPIMRNFNDT